MQLANAQRLVSDLLAAGYDATATQVTAGEWQVQTRAPAFVDQPTANAFAAQHQAAVAAYDVTTAVSFR